jgi:hypothetical protein
LKDDAKPLNISVEKFTSEISVNKFTETILVDTAVTASAFKVCKNDDDRDQFMLRVMRSRLDIPNFSDLETSNQTANKTFCSLGDLINEMEDVEDMTTQKIPKISNHFHHLK